MTTASIPPANPPVAPPAKGVPLPDGEVPVPPTPVMSKEDRDEQIRKSYAEATVHLRQTYLDEFNAFRQKFLDERGIAWSPKLTKEQAAAAQIQALAGQYGIDLTTLATPEVTE